MAYGVKYRCEYTDIQGVDWKVDILEDSYAGAISAMIASGEPLTIEYMTPSDELTLTPIKGSMATLNVECTTNFEYIGLYSEEDLLRPMNIYKNEVLYWSGWLSNEYTEPYDNVPYTVSITASDALGLLKNIPYDNAGTAYTGRDTETDIILRILGKIGHTTFTEYCNLYEDRMDDAVDDSLFDQALADNDLFIDADCYSVLQAILSSYNAVIRNRAGTLIIYRPTELIGDTVYGRVITAASTTGTSITPDKEIDREGMDLIDVEGGVLMYKAPMSNLTVSQDYGYKESWLKNYQFKTYTWGSEFANWTRVGSFGIAPAKDGGITFIPPAGATGVNDSHYVYQNFGTYGKQSATDVLRLKFDYEIDNQTGVSGSVTIKVALYDATFVHKLSMKDDTELFQWDNGSYNRIQWTVAGIQPGLNSYTFDQSVTGIPCDGGFQIRLYYTQEDTFLTIRNLQFLITSDQLNRVQETVRKWIIPGLIRYSYQRDLPVEVVDRDEIIGREYVVNNSVQGEDGEQTYILGDVEDTGMTNVLEQFEGSLAIQLVGSLEQTATDFVNDHAGDYIGGGVIVSSNGTNMITFTGNTTSNFTGSTTITNASGNLAGTVDNVQASSAQVNEQHTIELAGTSGTCDITVEGVTETATYATSPTITATNFVTNSAAAYAAVNVTVTSSGPILTFEADNGLFDTLYTTTAENVVADLSGDVDPNAQAYSEGTVRIDTITLTGTSGTANILCDGVTETATYSTETILGHTVSWHTRGNTEGKPLAELIGDEVADMYSKGRQMVQLNMVELTESLDVLNNLQDPLNLVGANNRVFAFNRGSLNAQMREWTIDIIEIGDK